MLTIPTEHQIRRRFFSPLLNEIAEVIGDWAVFALCREYGGGRVNVPSNSHDAKDILVELLDRETLTQVCSRLGGTAVRVPDDVDDLRYSGPTPFRQLSEIVGTKAARSICNQMRGRSLIVPQLDWLERPPTRLETVIGREAAIKLTEAFDGMKLDISSGPYSAQADRIVAVVQMRVAGVSLDETANKLRCSRTTVKRIVNAYRLPLKPKGTAFVSLSMPAPLEPPCASFAVDAPESSSPQTDRRCVHGA